MHSTLKRNSGQGALEYLLLIGGAVLIATIIMVIALTQIFPASSDIVNDNLSQYQNQITLNAFGLGGGSGSGSVCGNDIAESGEVCDGVDLDGETCVSQSFAGGTLACASNCLSFDTSSCTSPPTCGNGTIGSGETCDDGAALSGDGCSSSCQVEAGWNCSGEPSTCTSICGDALVVGTEVCDGANLNGQSCTTLGSGYTGGTLSCAGTCNTFVTSSCNQTVLFEVENYASLGAGLQVDSATYSPESVVTFLTGCTAANNTNTYSNFNVPVAGNYNVWVKADNVAGVAVSFNTTVITAAGSTIIPVPSSATIATWSGGTTVALPVGASTRNVQIQCNANLRVDKVMITNNTTCTPTGNGSNCS